MITLTSKSAWQKISLALLLSAAYISPCAATPATAYETQLPQGWTIQAADKTTADGQAISVPSFAPQGWTKTAVPSTVLGALADTGIYGDILALKNLDAVSSAPFAGAWWYRKEFTLPAAPGLSRTRLAFDGINYSADIWLNGRKVAAASAVKGSFRRFELDVTGFVNNKGKNVLAVQVFPPKPGDPTIGFVDWNPAPADSSMGLWRGVRLLRSGPVALHNPYVRTDVDTTTLKSADLTITVEAGNDSAAAVTGEVTGDIGPIHFSKKVSLAAGETKLVKFSAADTPALALKNPRLWWPHDLGKPELYDLNLKFKAGPAVSDALALRFGVRQVSDYLSPEGYRGYRVNGKQVLIRGGGWVDDILLRQSPEKVKAQVAYAKHMGLNTLRLESFWGEDEELFKDCDEAGILIMAGWSCQWEWPEYLGKPTDENFGGITSAADISLITASWKDHVLWLRNHPALLVWLYGSDLQPGPELEANYQNILKAEDPARPFLASASGRNSTLTGPTGVKMAGPYDYVPPSYWFTDKTHGGAFGFNTETGPGPQVPVRESLERMLGRDHLWPIDDIWLYHTARHEFYGLKRFNEAMDARLGKPADLNDYERKAQLLNYDGMRAMFEAFNVNKPNATGIIQWMFNASWPKLWWQFFDYYLTPTGAFYGARKANAPLHAVYNPADGKVYLVTRGLESYKKVSVELKALNASSVVEQDQSAMLDIGPNQAVRVPGLGGVNPPGNTYFIDLRVKDAAGRLLDSNFYTLSSVPDVLDEAKYYWATTPVLSHGDLNALAALPAVELKEQQRYGTDQAAGRRYIEVSLENPAKQVALAVELELYKAGTNELVTPIFWDDNFITLLPGEKRTLRAYYGRKDAGIKAPELKLRGWNIK